MTIVLKGVLEIAVGGHTQHLEPGQVSLSAMWEPHQWWGEGSPTQAATIAFAPEAIDEDILPDRHWMEMVSVPFLERPQIESPDARRRVLTLAHRLREEVCEHRAACEVMLRLGLLQLLVELERNWTRRPASGQGMSWEVNVLNRIRPALSLVESRQGRGLTPSAAARACRLGLTRFNVLFREATGTSFGKFCMRARVGLVAHRLLTTEMSVESIAEEAGFVDASHLHRTFVRHCACTPAEYRRRRSVETTVASKEALRSLLLGPDTADVIPEDMA